MVGLRILRNKKKGRSEKVERGARLGEMKEAKKLEVVKSMGPNRGG